MAATYDQIIEGLQLLSLADCGSGEAENVAAEQGVIYAGPEDDPVTAAVAHRLGALGWRDVQGGWWAINP